jgi:hypothetical protein
MLTARFTIRYRRRIAPDAVALLVEDDGGQLHVCSRSGLRPFLREARDPARRRATLRELGWVPVPAVAPYTLDGLRRLLGPAAA